MAKYGPRLGQAKMLPVRFEEQILPGTFEYTLNRLIDERFNLEVFDAHYKNDETGAPAYDPAILLKIIFYAYARGVTSSREIERLCRENVVFMRCRPTAGHTSPPSPPSSPGSGIRSSRCSGTCCSSVTNWG